MSWQRGNLERVNNLDFVVVHIKQLEGVARLGFASPRVALPIYGYGIQLFAWRQELFWSVA